MVHEQTKSMSANRCLNARFLPPSLPSLSPSLPTFLPRLSLSSFLSYQFSIITPLFFSPPHFPSPSSFILLLSLFLFLSSFLFPLSAFLLPPSSFLFPISSFLFPHSSKWRTSWEVRRHRLAPGQMRHVQDMIDSVRPFTSTSLVTRVQPLVLLGRWYYVLGRWYYVWFRPFFRI